VCPKDIEKLRATAPQLVVTRREDVIDGPLSNELLETIYEQGIGEGDDYLESCETT
jgi:hypothetical protein